MGVSMYDFKFFVCLGIKIQFFLESVFPHLASSLGKPNIMNNPIPHSITLDLLGETLTFKKSSYQKDISHKFNIVLR